MAIETYKVSVSHKTSDKNYHIKVRDFNLTLSSEPNDSHANTYETILEALGACESIVMASFNKQKNFKYNSLYYTLIGNQDQTGFSDIGVTVHFKTNESKQKCAEFVEFAENTCPVMDNLTHAVPITRTEVITVH